MKLHICYSLYCENSFCHCRNLVESTEELLSTHDSTAMYTSVDGVECVIIPTEMYHQMQTELSDLKEQLLCLSLLIQVCGGSVS